MSAQTLAKHLNGTTARAKWAKAIPTGGLTIFDFDKTCGYVFTKGADIVIDSSTKRQTTIACEPCDKKDWKTPSEYIYAIVRNSVIMKIGGTRDGMAKRFASYLCGHHVQERGKSGKMSVTNAHLYHTIENDLLDTESTWEFYTWKLPTVTLKVDVLGEETTIVAQTFHAYESRCIKKYKESTGSIPPFCDNCDPGYV